MTEKSVEPTPDERRSHPRIAAKIDIRFKGLEEAERTMRAYSVNVSMGGLCIRTQKPYQLGDRIELVIGLEGEEFDLFGVVAWSRHGTIGVRFVDLDSEDRHRLEALFEKMNNANQR